MGKRRHRPHLSPLILGSFYGLAIFAVAALMVWWLNVSRSSADTTPVLVLTSPSPLPSASPTSSPPPTPTLTPRPLPPSVLLEVPFLVQAPHAHWDALHEDACEEASVIMLNHFYTNTPLTSADAGDVEIKNLVAYETSNGYGPSITVSQLQTIATNYFHLSRARVKINPTIIDIKRELAVGHPVIVPAAGRQLPNPHFTPPGPIYHMLLIKGYDSQGFITNDPGIKEGKDFRYTEDALYNAIHDWDPQEILNGQKAYLVID